MSLQSFVPPTHRLSSALHGFRLSLERRQEVTKDQKEAQDVIKTVEEFLGTIMEIAGDEEPVEGCKPLGASLVDIKECSAIVGEVVSTECSSGSFGDESPAAEVYAALNCYCEGVPKVKPDDAEECLAAMCTNNKDAAAELKKSLLDIQITSTENCAKILPPFRALLEKGFTATIGGELATQAPVTFDKSATTTTNTTVPTTTTGFETVTTPHGNHTTTKEDSSTTTPDVTETDEGKPNEPTKPSEPSKTPDSAGPRLSVKGTLVFGLTIVSLLGLAL